MTRARRIRQFTLNPRYLIIGFITLILVVAQLSQHVLVSYYVLPIALGSCIASELLLSGLVRRKLANVSSAYISGISMTLLTEPPPGVLWPFAIGGFLAIASKYVLTYRGKHLWNPTNFAISALLLLAPAQVSILSHQWNNSLLPLVVIWFVGVLIVTRAGVLHITISYAAFFLVLAGIRSLVVGTPILAEIAPITGPMYQLFMFFMITDPRTTVKTKQGQILVVALVALLEMVIRIYGDFQVPAFQLLYPAPPIFALAIVGPIAKFVSIRMEGRKPSAAAGARVAAHT